jgi:hypothetical protein
MGVSRRKPRDDNNAQKHIGDVKKETKRFIFFFFSTRDAKCNGEDNMMSRSMIKDVEKHG